MTNPGFTRIEQYKDVESRNHFRILQEKGLSEENAYQILQIHSRDNSRTPMQWDETKNAGFTTGDPWIEVTKNHSYINAKAELEDPDSIFQHYKKLVQLRKDYDIIAYGDIEPLDQKNPSVFAYRRTYQGEEMYVINNFYGKEVTWKADKDLTEFCVLLSNYQDTMIHGNQVTLRPYESIVLHKK